MLRFLTRLYIKNSTDTSDPAVRGRYGKLAGITGIATNLLLFLIKIIAGIVSGSISITADAVNNLSDSGSSIITLIGFKISEKPADAEHPYGHGRMEYISGLIIAFIILLLGFQLIQSSIRKIIEPETVQFGLTALTLLVVTIPIKLWQSLFYKSIGKTIDSLPLMASSTDSLNDVMATLSILIAAIITHLTGLNLDGYMGIAMALFIIISGIKLVINTIDPLLGHKPKKELVNYIHDKVLSYEHIMGIHDLHVHSYGPSKCFASLHCEISAEQDIMLSHDIIDNIERDFLSEQGIYLVIHLDPVVTNDDKTNQLKENIENLISSISPEISIHDFRTVWGISHVKIIFDVSVPYNFKLKDSELKSIICGKITGLDAKYTPVIIIDHYG